MATTTRGPVSEATLAGVPGDLRIGELARRTGVSPELFRAWERRYGLLRPDLEALVAFDDVGAHAALDRLLSSLTLESVLRDSVLPALRDLGERWQRGEITIGQVHLGSNLLRGWMLGLARGWDPGSGPRALLCVPRRRAGPRRST